MQKNIREILINNRKIDNQSDGTTIGIYKGDRFAEGIAYLQNSNVEYLIREEAAYPMDAIARVISRTDDSDDILWQISNIVHGPHGMNWEIDIENAEAKTSAIELFEKYYQSHSTLKNSLPTVSLIVEELITNALYRAPANAEKLKIKPQKNSPIKLSIYHDTKRISLFCQDPFGTLSRENILARLSGLGDPASKPVDARQGGAGIRLLCANATDVMFYSERSVLTLVWVSFPIDGSHRSILTHRNLATVIRG